VARSNACGGSCDHHALSKSCIGGAGSDSDNHTYHESTGATISAVNSALAAGREVWVSVSIAADLDVPETAEASDNIASAEKLIEYFDHGSKLGQALQSGTLYSNTSGPQSSSTNTEYCRELTDPPIDDITDFSVKVTNEASTVCDDPVPPAVETAAFVNTGLYPKLCAEKP
jgi:hypothetical protein